MIRMLASKGIGIYFISEDIFTTASYYQRDMLDLDFCKTDQSLPPEYEDEGDTPFLPGGNHVE